MSHDHTALQMRSSYTHLNAAHSVHHTSQWHIHTLQTKQNKNFTHKNPKQNMIITAVHKEKKTSRNEIFSKKNKKRLITKRMESKIQRQIKIE